MSKLQWFAIFVFGITAFGVSYFLSSTPTAPTQEIDQEVDQETDQEINVETKTNGKGSKKDCGDGFCLTPETEKTCPVDCL